MNKDRLKILIDAGKTVLMDIAKRHQKTSSFHNCRVVADCEEGVRCLLKALEAIDNDD